MSDRQKNPVHSGHDRSTPDHVSRFLAAPGLSTLLDHAQQIELLQQAVRSSLPNPLQDYCQLVNWQAGKLVLGAASSVWAARLRLQQTRLRARLEQVLGNRIQRLEIRVIRQSGNPNPVSTEESQNLSASSASRDPVSALLRLERHVRQGKPGIKR